MERVERVDREATGGKGVGATDVVTEQLDVPSREDDRFDLRSDNGN